MLAIPFMSTRTAGISGNFRLRVHTFPPRTLSLPKQVEFLAMLCCIQKTKQIAFGTLLIVRCQLVLPPAPGPVCGLATYHRVRFRHPRIPGLGSITFGANVCLELYVHLLCHTIVTRLTTYDDKNAFGATKSQQKWAKLPNLVRSESVSQLMAKSIPNYRF